MHALSSRWCSAQFLRNSTVESSLLLRVACYTSWRRLNQEMTASVSRSMPACPLCCIVKLRAYPGSFLRKCCCSFICSNWWPFNVDSKKGLLIYNLIMVVQKQPCEREKRVPDRISPHNSFLWIGSACIPSLEFVAPTTSFIQPLPSACYSYEVSSSYVSCAKTAPTMTEGNMEIGWVHRPWLFRARYEVLLISLESRNAGNAGCVGICVPWLWISVSFCHADRESLFSSEVAFLVNS